MSDAPSPLTADLDDPFDDAELDTWIDRTMFDDNTPATVAEHVEPQATGHPLHGWRPADPDQAEWAMARLVEIEQELTKVHIEHDAWAERVDASRQGSTRSLEYRARFFTEALRGYALDWHDEYPRERRTLHLPSGIVKCTTPQSPTVQLVAAGRAELVAWLQGQDVKRVEQAKALKVADPEPMISGVRKLVEAIRVGDEWRVVDPASGEVVPGVRAEPPGPTTAKPVPHLA